MILMYSTFICVPKRVPIMECHSILTYLKLSIALPPDDFSVSTKAREKVFLHLTVHTVHLLVFLFNIMMIDGDQLVKSEQSTLHLSASLACFRRSSPQYDGDEGGVKSFFGENCSHCSLRVFVIYFHGVSV